MKSMVKKFRSLVAALFCTSLSTTAGAQNLLLHYSFDGANGSSVPDASGNNRKGSLSGMAKIIELNKKRILDNSESSMGSASANSGGSVRYVGTGFGKLKSFTITLWYKTEKPLQGGTRIFDFTGIGQSFLLGANSAKGNLDLNVGTKNILSHSSSIPLINSNGAWVFVAFVFDGTNVKENLRLYLGNPTTEGRYIAIGTTDSASWNFEGENAQLVFGANPQNGRSLAGQIADIRVYGDANNGDGALDHVQLRQLLMDTKPE